MAKTPRFNVQGYTPENPHKGSYRSDSGRFVRWEDYRYLLDEIKRLEAVLETRDLIEIAVKEMK